MSNKMKDFWATQTHCMNGHERNEQNTRIYNGRRFCAVCRREAKLRHYQKVNGDRKIKPRPRLTDEERDQRQRARAARYLRKLALLDEMDSLVEGGTIELTELGLEIDPS